MSLVIFLSAANWAQFSGEKLQNVAKVTDVYWENRWGHAMVGYLDTRRRENVIVVLGGETYNPETGLGRLSSDVWRTRGLGTY